MTDSWSPHSRQSRVAEIDSLSALESGDVTPDLRALLDLAVHFCGVSSAARNIVTDDAQHQIAAVGVEPSVCTSEESMCAVVLDSSEESMCAVVLDQPTLSVGNAVEDPNLVSNALKFTRPGVPARVHVTAVRHHTAGGTLTLHPRDPGTVMRLRLPA